ncbi:MAG: conjugal transfer protein TrbK [Alphaproteobacteria bacterium 65-37]|jgi:conjugative transfer region protein TrbK|uniref:putative entry exclusion protein TrbK-alt n=1 Tax=uncultured Reyranella sp. TaxID=735512 RepID=UPI00096511C4|nr:putative entry exclusion protein TrbK-alt [uncultured Reyranella sp.]OJU35001.1 MAG: conjugal transfer protein TrbK [Alphaproteobacteria bacterium 65-37]
MDARLLIRLAAVIFATAAIAATAFEMTQNEEGAATPAARSSEEITSDPLRAAQRRCQLLGEAAARDSECLRIWAETRDRFLGTAPSPTSPQLWHWR